MDNKPWTDQLKTNIASIDEEQKKLFKMIKFFLSMHKVGMSSKSIVKYVDDLTTHAHLYFAEQEKEMVKQEYPLLGYQANKNSDIKERLKEAKTMCKTERIQLIDKTIYELSVKLLNEHLTKDDLAFVDFCNRQNVFEDSSLEGCHCDLHSLENKFWGKGKIDEINVQKSQIHITSNGTIPITAGLCETVKVTVNNKTGGLQVWLARVFNVGKSEISLFAPILIAKENRRKYIRVHKDIDASIEYKGEISKGVVNDISLGGVLIKTDIDFSIGEKFKLTINLLEKDVTLDLEIVREAIRNQEKFGYGCKTVDLAVGQQDIVSEYIFVNQRHS